MGPEYLKKLIFRIFLFLSIQDSADVKCTEADIKVMKYLQVRLFEHGEISSPYVASLLAQE
jgi:hypothetical protein